MGKTKSGGWGRCFDGIRFDEGSCRVIVRGDSIIIDAELKPPMGSKTDRVSYKAVIDEGALEETVRGFSGEMEDPIREGPPLEKIIEHLRGKGALDVVQRIEQAYGLNKPDVEPRNIGE